MNMVHEREGRKKSYGRGCLRIISFANEVVLSFLVQDLGTGEGPNDDLRSKR